MKQARVAGLSLVMGAAMLAFCTPSIASACISAVRQVRPSPDQMVSSAEKVLEVSPVEAARVINTNFPGIKSVAPGTNPISTRALRVLAVATVRTTAKAEDLDWAVKTLRAVDAVRKNDPAVQADLGEALAKTANGKAEALGILSKLADKDLMGSPHAYAALASLRQQKGDAAGAEAAMTKCREMSGKTAATTCKLQVSVAAKA